MTEMITVVVPTRERADTLRHCLETIVSQDCDRLTILVSDNASSPATREVVDSFNDKRIAYVNTGQRLSMSHNYEFALSHVREGWIAMIGDDDGLLPGRLEPAVAELEAAGLKALGADVCFYNWPDATPDEAVRLSVPTGSRVRRIRSADAMTSALKLQPHIVRMPQTYTGGIVHSSVVNDVREKRGTFYQSQIPDVFSGFAICSMVDSILCSQKPFAIAGRSSHSIGSALFSQQKPTFLDEGLIPFHPDFPMPASGTLTYSMPAIFFESYTQAAYLHGGNPPVSKQHMLEVTLARTLFGRSEILEWGKQFAALHGLDYDAALNAARRMEARIRPVLLARRLRNLWENARVYRGDPRPLANVREAAETADAILRSPPNRLIQSTRSVLRKRG